MRQPIPLSKRGFDIVVGSVMLVLLLPLLTLLAIGIVALEGRPVLYVSRRRLNGGPAESLVKFRTMRRGADRIANRDTMPIGSTRFLNLPIHSPLYTPIGRLIERLMLTEMPQLLHVLQGRMSIVGNRPLPDNVVRSLCEAHDGVEDRFLTPGGLTGPVQLVGREYISDARRLEIEAAYCHAVLTRYSMILDLRILALTVIGGCLASTRLASNDVLTLIRRHGAPIPQRMRIEDPERHGRAIREGSNNR